MAYEEKAGADASDLPKVIGELGQAFEEFKSRNEHEIKEIKAGIKAAPADLGKVEEALTKLHAAKDAIELKLEGEVKARKQLEALLVRPGMGHNGGPLLEEEKQIKSFQALLKAGTAVDATAYGDYRKAFGTMLRKTDKAITAEEHKALSIGIDPDGGYLITPDVSGRIVTRVFETSPMRNVAAVQLIGTDALEGLRDTDEAASGGWVAETATRGETNTPQFAKWRIPVFEMFAQPAATQSLLDDQNVDVEGWLAMKVADRLTRVENAAFITGDGVNKPRGIANYPTAATNDASRAWGTFEHINTGANGAFLTTAAAPDCLFDVIGAMKDAYTANAQWMTRREAITAVRKLKEATTNAYIWQPGLAQGRPQTLLGFPVTIAQDMPALGAGSLSMAFGDFREAYQIVDRAGFRTLRDPYTAKPYVRFYTTRRVGGGALQFEAVKFIRFGT